MKTITTKNHSLIRLNINLTFCFLVFFGLSQKGFTQVQLTNLNEPHIYASTGIAVFFDRTQITGIPNITEGYYRSEKLNLSVGYQFNNSISLEFTYLQRNLKISSSAFKITDMRTVSMSIVNCIPIKKERLWLKQKVGYVMGFIPSTQNLSSSTITLLSDGMQDFVLFGLGIEFRLSTRLSLGLGYFRHQGFKEIGIIESEFDDVGIERNSQAITRGTMHGGEFSIIYRFK